MPALEAARLARHEDLPFTPALFVKLSNANLTKQEVFVPKMRIVAFRFLMLVDEFSDLITSIESI